MHSHPPHRNELYDCEERLQSFGGPVSVITGPFKPALDADNRYTGGANASRYTGGAATRASKPAGGYSDAQLTPWARNGECG